MHSEAKTGIIILNWNGLEDTIECLDSLRKIAITNNFFVVLVDNNSEEPLDKIQKLNLSFEVSVIKNQENLGFAGGNNKGIEYALKKNAKYIFLLNNDTVIIDDVLQVLISVLKNNKKIGIVGAVNYYYDNPELIWQSGFRYSLKNGKMKSVSDDLYNEKTVYVDYVPGSSLFIRSKIIKKIGFMDANFFAYGEEKDWCRRLKKVNYDVVFSREARILHKVGKSSSGVIKTYLRTRNNLYFFRKHSKVFYLIYIQSVDIFRLLLKSLYYSFKGDLINALAILLGIYDFYTKNMGLGRIPYLMSIISKK